MDKSPAFHFGITFQCALGGAFGGFLVHPSLTGRRLARACLIAGFAAAFAMAAQADRTIALLGSSIAAGVGATTYDSAWAGRYAKHLAALNPAWKLASLAVPGYTTFHVLATGTKAVTGRPVVDTAHNITKALSLHPQALIISLTGNDISNGFAPEEYYANFDTLYAQATRAGVKVWMTTPTPRTAVDSAKRDRIKALRQRILGRYPHVIDFYDSLAMPDATIKKIYDSGDGVHPTNAGHAILYGRVAAADIPGALTVGIIDPRRAARAGMGGWLPAIMGNERDALGRLSQGGVTWK